MILVRIWDGFTFFNELDLLEMRLFELHDVVHRFILVESTVTYSGQPKPLYFAENRERFRPWLDRIIHVVVRDMPETTDPWAREIHQRDAIARGMLNADPDDLLMVSDVDEIPRRSIISQCHQSASDWIALRMPTFYLKLNYANIAGHPHDALTIATRTKRFVSPSKARASRFGPKVDQFKGEEGISAGIAQHAGWHFSYLGDVETVRHKIASFSHQEYNTPEMLASIDIDAIIRRGDDLFGRPQFKWSSVKFDNYFNMRLVREQPDRFAQHIIQDADWRIDSNTGGNQLALLPVT